MSAIREWSVESTHKIKVDTLSIRPDFIALLGSLVNHVEGDIAPVAGTGLYSKISIVNLAEGVAMCMEVYEPSIVSYCLVLRVFAKSRDIALNALKDKSIWDIFKG